MRHDHDAAAAAITVADDARSALLADLPGWVAGCFPRRETRQCRGQMVNGLLMELDDHNCWTIAEAVGLYRFKNQRRYCDLRFGRMSWLRQDRGPCLFACFT